MFQKYKFEINKQEIEELFSLVDANKDGKSISLNLFNYFQRLTFIFTLTKSYLFNVLI